jgi:hypothetical protein
MSTDDISNIISILLLETDARSWRSWIQYIPDVVHELTKLVFTYIWRTSQENESSLFREQNER